MYATAIIPAMLVTIGRFFVTESGHWLLAHGSVEAATRDDRPAARAQSALSARDPSLPPHAPARQAPGSATRRCSADANRRATIFASVPWFLQDLGTYGIGIFTPTILAATLGHKAAHARNLADLITNDQLAAKGAALIDVLLIVGIIFAVLLADRVGRMRCRSWASSDARPGCARRRSPPTPTTPRRIALIFAGFMLFNFMTNIGPNAQTYLLAGEVFPTRLRGTGAGFAAAVGKVGAITDRLPVPDPARRHRHPGAAHDPGRHVASWRGRNLGIPDRDHGRQPGKDRVLAMPVRGTLSSVMAGPAEGQVRPSTPSLWFNAVKTWMPATSAGMTPW